MTKGLLQVQNLAMSSRTFRTRLISDPIDAIKQAGLVLTKAELLTVKSEIERLKTSKTIKEIDEVFRTGSPLGW
jgi:hypothetical protein